MLFYRIVFDVMQCPLVNIFRLTQTIHKIINSDFWKQFFSKVYFPPKSDRAPLICRFEHFKFYGVYRSLTFEPCLVVTSGERPRPPGPLLYIPSTHVALVSTDRLSVDRHKFARYFSPEFEFGWISMKLYMKYLLLSLRILPGSSDCKF